MEEARRVAEKAEQEATTQPGPDGVLALDSRRYLGLPVEENAPAVRCWPWLDLWGGCGAGGRYLPDGPAIWRRRSSATGWCPPNSGGTAASPSSPASSSTPDCCT